MNINNLNNIDNKSNNSLNNLKTYNAYKTAAKAALKHNWPLIGIGVLFLLLTVLFAASHSSRNNSNASQRGSINSAEDAARYLAQCGWETAAEPSSMRLATIPAQFDKMYEEYNAMQLLQGFDLTPHRSVRVIIYTFRVVNHPSGAANVFANVLVRDGDVIAGDLVSYALDGWIEPLIAA